MSFGLTVIMPLVGGGDAGLLSRLWKCGRLRTTRWPRRHFIGATRAFVAVVGGNVVVVVVDAVVGGEGG